MRILQLSLFAAALSAGPLAVAPISNAEDPPRDAVLDRVQALEQELALLKRKLEWGVGLNWYLNRFLKLGFNWEHLDFTNANGNSDNPDEGVFLTRLQLAY